MTTDRPRESPDVDPDPAAPIPNPGLDTLRRQVNVTTVLSFMLMVGSLLALAVLALFDPTVTVFCSVFVMLTLAASLMLAIVMKLLYVIRGGNLTAIDVLGLGIQIWFLPPTLVAFYFFIATAINQS